MKKLAVVLLSLSLLALAVVLLSLSLLAQTAKFPNSIATRADLPVAVNNIQTTLSANIGPSDIYIAVASSTGMVPNMLLTIDSEEVLVCNIIGNSLMIGKSSCPNVDGRAIEGTAAIHARGAKISAFIDAWNYNAAAAEIIATETALGPGLSNLFPSVGVSSTLYNFAPQSPSSPASLSPGNNTVTLHPCPKGVYGNASIAPGTNNYFVWVSATGSPEKAYVVTSGPGTCDGSGVNSGTITINVTGPHPAGYTIGPASGGVQEAIIANPGAKINLPCAQIPVYATISMGQPNELAGCGMDVYAINGTVFLSEDTSGTLATINMSNPVPAQQGQGPNLHDFSILCVNARECGYGIVVNGGTLGLVNAQLARIAMQQPVTGLLLLNCEHCRVQDVDVLHTGNAGISVADGSNATVLDHVGSFDSAWNNGGANLIIADSSDVTIGNSSDIEGCGGEGSGVHPGVTACTDVLITGTSTNTAFINSYIEHADPAGASLIYVAATAQNTIISGNHLQDGAVVSDSVDLLLGPNYWYSSTTSPTTSFTQSTGNLSTFRWYGNQTIASGSNAIAFSPTSIVGQIATAIIDSGTMTIDWNPVFIMPPTTSSVSGVLSRAPVGTSGVFRVPPGVTITFVASSTVGVSGVALPGKQYNWYLDASGVFWPGI